MPALLELTSLDELTSPPSPDANNPEPLYITFNAGYAPLGTFCGLITRLISLGPNGIFGLNWELVEDGIKRNCVSFLIAKSNKVTLISSETCFEIRLTRSQSLMSLHDLCSHVLTVILYVMKSLYKNLVPRVAFQCSCPYYIESGRSDNHLCVLTEEPQVLFLCQSRPVNLKIYQQVWLGKFASPGQNTSLSVFKFSSKQSLQDFSFDWGKIQGDSTPPIAPDQRNVIAFQNVSEVDFGYYRCEVKDAGNVMFVIYKSLFRFGEEFTLKIVSQPKDILCEPGEKLEFMFETSPKANSYQWYFNESEISDEDQDYEGSTTEQLVLSKCLPKHKGFFKCVVTNDTGRSLASETATLMIGGEVIGVEESVLLGEILKASNINFGESGVDFEQLLQGNSGLTYEELQFILKDNSITRILSLTLKQELQTRLQEEKLYQAAISDGKKVSLSYIKILALGPGQIGKSTFLYRLLGLMKGNIDTAPPETLPPCSTGQTDLREVCIKLNNITGVITPEKNWDFCDLQTQLEGLMWLLAEQSQDVASSSTVSSLSEADDKLEKTKKPRNKRNESAVSSQLKAVVEEDLNQHVSEKSIPGEGSEELVSDDELTSKPIPIAQSLSHHFSTGVVGKAITEYEDLRVKCKHSPNITKLHMLFNIADVGGQPAFLDMLPSLTIGPALYFLFSKLVNDEDQVLSIEDFTTKQTVKYCAIVDNEPQDCPGYTYTLHEVLLSALSSIACFGLSDEQVERYISKESKYEKTSSLSILLGTYADKVNADNNSKLVETETALKSFLEQTDYYQKNLISFPNPAHPEHYHGQVFFRVDNKFGSDQEIKNYREIIQELVEEKFTRYDIPTAWLGLGICMKILAKNQETYAVSLDDCFEMGKHFKMNRHMVKAALNFLHKYVGLVMYFPNDTHLKDLVICNPQVVFSSISELIFNVYDSTSRKQKLVEVSSQQKSFEKTGIFTPETVEYVKPEESYKFLSFPDLVHLLVHLNIAAEVTLKDTDSPVENNKEVYHIVCEQKKKEYFLPAILRTAEISSLVMESQGLNEELLPEALCIRFQTGYLPMGFSCALSARLLAEEKFKLTPDESIVYKNKMKFRFDGQFNVTMISLPLRCEFHVTRHYGCKEFHDLDCCPEIMKTVCECTDWVLKSMQKTLLTRNSYDLAFKCPKHQNIKFGYEPLAKFVYSDVSRSRLKQIECQECSTTITNLSHEMKIWFGEKPVMLFSITKQPSIKENRILIVVQGTKPIRYQWFKNDEELSDGHLYDGTTTPELVLKESSSPEVKGKYMCQVTDKYEELKVSKEIEYDPFIDELKLRGLRMGEISKLIKIGVQSLEDLQYLEEKDFSEINLLLLERSRVKKLLNELRSKENSNRVMAPSEPHLDASSIIGEQKPEPNAAEIKPLEDSKSLTDDTEAIIYSDSFPGGASSCKASKLWNLHSLHQRPLNSSGARLNGEGIKIAVLDTGFFIHHNSFKEKLHQVKVFNFVKDSSGKSLAHETVLTFPKNHCTAVVSLIFQVAPKATVYIMRIATSTSLPKSETVADCFVDALSYISRMDDETRPDIVSISFGFPPDAFKDSTKCRRIINALEDKGTICVAAVGNEGAHQKYIPIPAMFSTVLSVGSLNKDGKVSSFTPSSREVNLYAYGEDLAVPCLPEKCDPSGFHGKCKVDPTTHEVEITSELEGVNTNHTVSESGTSMATPMFAGLLALLFQYADVKLFKGRKCAKIRTCDQIKHVVISHLQDAMHTNVLRPTEFFQNVDKELAIYIQSKEKYKMSDFDYLSLFL